MGTIQVSARTRLARRLGVVVAAAAVTTVWQEGVAATREPSHFLSVSGIYVEPDNDRGADYGSGFGIGYAQRIDEKVWWEARLYEAVLDTGANTAIDFYQTGFGVDLLQPLSDQSRSHFFVLAGGGGVLNDVSPGTNSGGSGYLDLGLGWRGHTSDSWGLRPRLELRVFHDYFDSGQIDLQFGLVLEIPPKPERIVEKIVEIEKIVQVPVEVERIVEKEIVCIVPSVEIAQAGPVAPADADGDGVPDDKDKCLGTLTGAKVDADGCVLKKAQSINLPNVEFESGSAVLTANGKEKLEPVAAFLTNQPDVQMEVVGHTDAQGSETYNQKLSEGRAEAVVEYLEGRGIAHARLSSKGRGESQPIASNKTKEGRAQNRRVELRIRAK